MAAGGREVGGPRSIAAPRVFSGACQLCPRGPTMPQYQTWEEFSRAAEKLYLADPMKARVVLKYRHSDGSLCIKVTDDLVCLVYRTDQAQDVKKIEKFHSQLMRLMVAKESRSVAMETD